MVWAQTTLHGCVPSDGNGVSLALASRSPRRRLLLEEAGIGFVTADPGVDDGGLAPGAIGPAEWVAALAYLKASGGWAARAGSGAEIVLGADTVCVIDGRIFGQPRDEDSATRMLEAMDGRTHEVLTGVALLWRDREVPRREVFADRAVVRLEGVGKGRIAEYVAGGAWRGKAGGYNLEERLAAGWPLSVEGDPTTVVGLPMERLVPRLVRLGVAGKSGRIA